MRILAALLSLLAVTAVVRADEPSVKAAVEKAVKRLETGVANYPKHRQCFSCHHQAMAVFSLTAAKERGFAVDDELLKEQVPFSLKTFRNTGPIAKGRGVGGEVTSVVYALATFAAAGHPRDETTDALVEYLLVRQSKDGSWPVPAFGERPPTMGSRFTNVGLAVAALKHYGPADEPEGDDDRQQRVDTALAKARAWLLANEPASTEDKVFHLRGLVDAGVETKHVTAARDRLLKEQREDGSWSQLPDKDGDAYATATVLVVLRKAGLHTGHEAYQKGVKYLLESQKEDGAWVVQTRSKPLQPFFDNGDPGGKSQFISFAATGWATLALLETVTAAPTDGKKTP